MLIDDAIAMNIIIIRPTLTPTTAALLSAEKMAESTPSTLSKLAVVAVTKDLVTSMGFSNLKPKQVDAIDAFLKGHDVFVSLPTGYGKSLIFAMLPPLFDLLQGKSSRDSSIAIVVSPLAALMMEQKCTFSRMGLKCKFLGELQTDEAICARVNRGHYQLMILSPEHLFYNSSLRDMLLSPIYQERLVGFIVDEAHCIKTW